LLCVFFFFLFVLFFFCLVGFCWFCSPNEPPRFGVGGFCWFFFWGFWGLWGGFVLFVCVVVFGCFVFFCCADGINALWGSTPYAPGGDVASTESIRRERHDLTKTGKKIPRGLVTTKGLMMTPNDILWRTKTTL